MTTIYEPSCFKHLGKLGRGGTAEVAKVFSLKHNCLAALKHSLKNTDNKQIDFSLLAQREQKLIGNIKFPGIVRIIDISNDEPQYLLLELCTGPTLEKAGKIENLAVALNILSAIAVNIEFIQAKTIIHGDLKPDNIFLPADWKSYSNNKLFYVKFSDFSLGRFLSEPDSSRAGLGTVGYMAPETVIDSRVSISSDIFALGIIAYQLLTGQHPFMNNTSDPVMINSRIREDSPLPIETVRPDLNLKIINLVNLLLSKDDNQRPQSGWEICNLLKDAGAAYPFEKAIKPAHLIDISKPHNENIESYLTLKNNEADKLKVYTDSDNTRLRLILTGNFIVSNLKYSNRKFYFVSNIHLSNFLRTYALNIFKNSSLQQKKLIIKISIAGSREIAEKLDIMKHALASDIPAFLFDIIIQFLRTVTIKRLALPMAIDAQKKGLYETAANLFMYAGKINDARQCANQAVKLFTKDNNFQQALQILNKIINYGKITDSEFLIRQLIMIRGDILKDIGEADAAYISYQKIIKLYKNHTPDRLLAETYKDLGDLYKIKQNFDEGIKALNDALKIYKKINDELEISHTLNNIGNIYWIIGDYKSALKHYRQALTIQKHLSAKKDFASTLNNMGAIYSISGRHSRGINLLTLALKLKKELGDLSEIARTLNNLGYTYYLTGNHKKALSCIKESLEINRKTGRQKEILYNLENLTTIMIISGKLKQSIKHLKEGLALATTLDDTSHIGIFNINIGLVLTRIGKFSEAQKCFRLAEKISDKIDYNHLDMGLKIALANLSFYLGNNSKALKQAREALNNAEAVANKNSRLNALMIITRITDDRNYFNQAYKLSEELHLNREKVILQFNQLMFLVLSNKTIDAEKLFNRISPELSKLEDEIELAWFLNIAAEYALMLNKIDDADKYLNKAQKIADESGLMSESLKTHSLLGQINFSQKKYEDCFSNYKKALQIAKDIANNIDSKEDSQTFQNQPTITFLVEEIRRLGKFMKQKKGRYDTCPK
ncbi:MAG: tetratricopeptide repeat protein [Candidatus Zixiibacteriota bacterium]